MACTCKDGSGKCKAAAVVGGAVGSSFFAWGQSFSPNNPINIITTKIGFAGCTTIGAGIAYFMVTSGNLLSYVGTNLLDSLLSPINSIISSFNHSEESLSTTDMQNVTCNCGCGGSCGCNENTYHFDHHPHHDNSTMTFSGMCLTNY